MSDMMDPNKVKALGELFEKLCAELKKASFRPRFILGTGEEKIKTVKKYIRALETLGVPVPEFDPLIADLLKSDLVPGREIWAICTDRPKK
jgi:hypothetical protein